MTGKRKVPSAPQGRRAMFHRARGQEHPDPTPVALMAPASAPRESIRDELRRVVQEVFASQGVGLNAPIPVPDLDEEGSFLDEAPTTVYEAVCMVDGEEVDEAVLESLPAAIEDDQGEEQGSEEPSEASASEEGEGEQAPSG